MEKHNQIRACFSRVVVFFYVWLLFCVLLTGCDHSRRADTDNSTGSQSDGNSYDPAAGTESQEAVNFIRPFVADIVELRELMNGLEDNTGFDKIIGDVERLRQDAETAEINEKVYGISSVDVSLKSMIGQIDSLRLSVSQQLTEMPQRRDGLMANLNALYEKADSLYRLSLLTAEANPQIIDGGIQRTIEQIQEREDSIGESIQIVLFVSLASLILSLLSAGVSLFVMRKQMVRHLDEEQAKRTANKKQREELQDILKNHIEEARKLQEGINSENRATFDNYLKRIEKSNVSIAGNTSQPSTSFNTNPSIETDNSLTHFRFERGLLKKTTLGLVEFSGRPTGVQDEYEIWPNPWRLEYVPPLGQDLRQISRNGVYYSPGIKDLFDIEPKELPSSVRDCQIKVETYAKIQKCADVSYQLYKRGRIRAREA